ncbi:MAG: T9SS type A sorting domain-containing protein [Bacteroidales bacterium]
MKKFTLFFAILFILCSASFAQEEVLVGWTFPENSAIADTGITVNLDKEVITLGGTSAIEFKNGFTTKAAQASGWNDGMDLKAWAISFSTEGYSVLSISSMQTSGGNDPGPKDFKIQYSIDSGVSWMDVPNGGVVVENDWTTGVVVNLELPSECNDKAEVQIRWVMTSNEASGSGGAVLESGKSKIDEIYVRGDKISGIADNSIGIVMEIGPNPTSNFLTMKSNVKMQNIILSDISGKILLNSTVNSCFEVVYLPQLPKGLYLLSIAIKDNDHIFKRKIVLQ